MIGHIRRIYFSKPRHIWTGVIAAAIVIALFIESFWFEINFPKKTEHIIEVQQHLSKPVKIVQVSDLHLRYLEKYHDRIIQSIINLKPDIILLTGDLVDNNASLDEFEMFLEKLPYNLTKIAVTGNWEYWGNVDLDMLETIYKKHNCTFLRNKSIAIKNNDFSILFTGLEDYLGGKASIKNATYGIKDSFNFRILLQHSPGYLDERAVLLKNGHVQFDLMLSGHTHGGQFNFFGFVPFLPKGSNHYVSGWYKKNRPWLYVSKGLGTSIIPARFNCRAELPVFILKNN